MTKNFGQDFHYGETPPVAADRTKLRRVISICFDLAFPLLMVAIALAVGQYFSVL